METNGLVAQEGGVEKTMRSARGSNQKHVRAHNERLVLTLIRERGALAKAEIARITKLSAQTVSVIMRALEAEGVLLKGQPVRGKVGQPQVPMSLAPKGAYFLGLKVGRRSLELVLTDFHGTIVGRKTQVHEFPTPERVVAFARDASKALIDTLARARQLRVAGMGIGIPFRLWDWADAFGVAPEELACWKDCDILADIAAQCDFPVYLQNDATAACGGELVFGTKRRPENFLYFYVGFFIGGGLVLDSTLFTGPTGNAAGLGPMPAGYKDGKAVQLLDVASLRSLEEAVVAAGKPDALSWERTDNWSVPASAAQSWLRDASKGLAQAIYSSSCLIDFRDVLIDGWMPEDFRATLVEYTQTALAELNWVGVDCPELHQGSLGGDARVLGAASLPLSAHFLVRNMAQLHE